MQGSPSYRNNFGPDSVEDLKNNINSTHEDFLREDDPIKKADALRYMSAYAMQFLYLVPHDRKFIFKETERVLHQSAMNIGSFDPREASIAFEYVGRYAQNILDQPWRKDFHTIKLTSGFYVHNISAQLCNAHEIFVTMGYVHVDETTLKVVPKLDEKRIKNVSVDMIVASQECLILSSIWQRVADQEPDYPLTIGEVFEFRRKYLGDTDTICRTMLMDIRRRHHDDKMMQHRGKNFVPVDKLIDYEEMDVDSRDGPHSMGGAGINEVEVVEKVHQHTRLLHDAKPKPRYDDEHIYDPVYPGDESGSVNGHTQNRNNYTSLYSSRNGGSSAFVPLSKPDQQYSARESVSSPLIPQTVSNFNTYSSGAAGRRSDTGFQQFQLPLNSSGGGSSSNSSGISDRMTSQASNKNNYALGTNPPLQFSKMSPEEMAWEREKLNRIGTTKPENHHGGTTIHWSEWAGHSNVEKPVQTHRRRHSERPTISSESINRNNDNNSRSRKPIMPSDVYPDDGYFPRVVKPTPVHSTLPQQQQRYNGSHSSTTTTTTTSTYNRYLPLSSPSPSPSKANSPATETNLDSLQNLYYKKLLTNQPTDTTPTDDGSQENYRDESPDPRPIFSPTLKTTTSTSTSTDGDLNFNTVVPRKTLGKPMQDKQIINPSTTAQQQQPKIVPWNCRFCTFKNKKEERICEMCSKSKDYFDEEEEEEEEESELERTVIEFKPRETPPPPQVPKLYSQPNPKASAADPSTTPVTPTDPNMVPCLQCTLLNPRSQFECAACGFRLKNAKTFN